MANPTTHPSGSPTTGPKMTLAQARAIQSSDYPELARLHVAGWSDARIANALAGCHRSTVTRARTLPVAQDLIAAERKRPGPPAPGSQTRPRPRRQAAPAGRRHHAGAGLVRG